MSERVRETILSSLFASKRFVVSVCAAIAMVLGAMSAGASVFTGELPPGQVSSTMPFGATTTGSNDIIVSKNGALAKKPAIGTPVIIGATPQYTTSQTPTKLHKNSLPDHVLSSTNDSIFLAEIPLLDQIQTPSADNPISGGTGDSASSAPTAQDNTPSTEPMPTEEPAVAPPPTTEPVPSDSNASPSIYSTDPPPSESKPEQ